MEKHPRPPVTGDRRRAGGSHDMAQHCGAKALTGPLAFVKKKESRKSRVSPFFPLSKFFFLFCLNLLLGEKTKEKVVSHHFSH
jgi:hypothetical protein